MFFIHQSTISYSIQWIVKCDEINTTISESIDDFQVNWSEIKCSGYVEEEERKPIAAFSF